MSADVVEITIQIKVDGPEAKVTVDAPDIEVEQDLEPVEAPEPPRIRRAASWRRRAADVDPHEAEAELLEILREIGEDRAEAEREHKATVEALHLVKEEALNRGISMSRISRLAGVSRQWLYAMNNFAGRDAA